MDFSIVYRVLYEPQKVFESLAGKYKDEGRVLIYATLGVFLLRTIPLLKQEPFSSLTPLYSILLLSSMAFMFTLAFLTIPFVESAFVYFVNKRTPSIKFKQVFAAVMLCAVPNFLYILLTSVVDYHYFGFGVMFNFIAKSHPFIHGAISIVTIFFLWTAALWWFAFGTLFKLNKNTLIVIIAALVIFEMLLGGAVSLIQPEMLMPAPD
ncbi:MAG: hypothetical protein HY954_10475 [Deltaproteobacteria bacterium]|nr:hypothetical protein [Deltaproteobacteria bacterium]